MSVSLQRPENAISRLLGRLEDDPHAARVNGRLGARIRH
jgi:hypothetical protein